MTDLLYCAEAKRLLEALAESIHELVKLHVEQFQEVLAGEADSTRFDALIYSANERKHEAKYAYMHHLEAHGCSTFEGAKIGKLTQPSEVAGQFFNDAQTDPA